MTENNAGVSVLGREGGRRREGGREGERTEVALALLVVKQNKNVK